MVLVKTASPPSTSRNRAASPLKSQPGSTSARTALPSVAPQPTSCADALLYVNSAEAERMMNNNAELRPVENWALPTVDLAASDERLEHVRGVAGSMHNLMAGLDEGDGSADIHAPGGSFTVMLEQQQQQREHMREVSSILDNHMQKHEEVSGLASASAGLPHA